ncbi:hypothetical protein EDB81DRAFT_351723 [Dactylonectria macrodidyma]|uniref:H-type lectin domain-containing protein n=1 Tax=Dactylonectria macrodidyma TaxID=307937 RepID=A0A9P9FHD3_9HYPO|nr:hypothetical protein EDB81DRAFT_351723 [Dactylonectria macrodidyma]
MPNMSTTTAITTIAPIVRHTHKAPAMFCAPGNPQDPKTSFGGFGDNIDSVVPWPAGSRLRVAMESNERIPSWVIDTIKSTLAEWTKDLGEILAVQWSSESNFSEIRISFRTDMPNWSCVGPRAYLYAQSKPTMNFNFGGSKDSKAVYSHAYVRRLASHLFGHALGLPHALLSEEPFQCKPGELEKLCGSYYAQMLGSARGCGLLRDAQSIMRYDLPGALGIDGTDFLQGGHVIDTEALALVRSLYPPVLESCCFTCNVGQLDGFQQGWDGRASGTRFFNTAQTANVVTGICMIHMGLTGNFLLLSEATNVQRGSGYTVGIRTWGNTHLINATCNVLSFDEADQRVKTGRVHWMHLPGGNERSYRENFSRPFNKTPNVVVFISGFDTIKGKYIRVEVTASGIDKNGFTLNMRTWNDTIVYGIVASWIAHEPDDWTIRSGTLDHPFDPNLTRVGRCTKQYSSPLRRRPRKLFYAFSRIDVQPNSEIRLILDATCDEAKVDGVFSTWMEESKFYLCSGSYVAIL